MKPEYVLLFAKGKKLTPLSISEGQITAQITALLKDSRKLRLELNATETSLMSQTEATFLGCEVQLQRDCPVLLVCWSKEQAASSNNTPHP